MPVPNFNEFLSMIEVAKSEKFAYPAINVASIDAANAALAAFNETNSDGIIQVSIGGAKFISGPAEDSVAGAITLAEHVHRIASGLKIKVALCTDHCQKKDIKFVEELIEVTKERKSSGKDTPLYNGHMFDGSALPLKENLELAKELLEKCKEAGIIPEFEAGVVGGEEDGASSASHNDEMYTTPEDMLTVAEKLFPIEHPFLFAAIFGNVHGMYKPGNVKLKPEILRSGQEAVSAKYGKPNPFHLVFHGGSGTPAEQISETLQYGVVKMNVDTATQYAFTRPIVDHIFKNYDEILMIDGGMGNKKLFDPRSYLKSAKSGMKERVIQALNELGSIGKS